MIDIIDILGQNRLHNSEGERLFHNQLCEVLVDAAIAHNADDNNTHPADIYTDGAGNIWYELGEKRDNPFLFVCHLDTVHNPNVKPNVIVEAHPNYRARLTNPEAGCLGADDAVGIYINLMMIEAGVQGTYLFTRGEECGNIGASWIVDNTPHKLEDFLLCVEVDRRGTKEIVLEQCTGKCASDTFGKALSNMLDMGHTISYNGIFTDNSVFNSYIPECVNIAAGYEGQHGPKEMVDLEYVMNLTSAMLAVDWSKLPIERLTSDIGNAFGNYYLDASYGWGGHGNYYDNGSTVGSADVCAFGKDGAFEYVKANPDKVAYWLYTQNCSQADIEETWEFGELIF